MAGRLYRMAKVVSANPASWGIVDANQISGFRTVAKLTDLYSIAACILSSSYSDGTTTGADAVGQIWHVQEDDSDYRLINWASRGKDAGWEKVPTVDEIYTALGDEITPILEELKEKDGTLENSINSLKSKVDENKSLIDINTLNIFWTINHFGQPEGFATLDSKGFVPLKQLGNLDTTLFEVVTELPSTIATIKKHIYLKAAGTTGDKNNYAEYIYTGDLTATYDATKWEKLGEVTANIDFGEYYKKTEVYNKTEIDGKVGANKYVHPSYTSTPTKALYKINVDGHGHVSGYADVTKADITALGIPGTVDVAMSATSTNAVQNKVIDNAIKTHKINSDNLDGDLPGTDGTDYSILGENTENGNVSSLAESFVFHFNPMTGSSWLSINGSPVWDDTSLKALTDTELNEILK